jgi:hypothetical protein
VADRYGRDRADAVATDLAHLAPDLLRWHLPRCAGGGVGPLRPLSAVTLALYRIPVHPPELRAGTSGFLALQVRTPVAADAAQRLVLQLGPVRHGVLLGQHPVERWDEARFRWDARAADGLREHYGGGRVPFHHVDGRPLAPNELPTAAATNGDPVRLAEWAILLESSHRDVEAWAAFDVEVEPDHLRLLEHSLAQGDRPVSAAALLPALRRHLARNAAGYGLEFRAVAAHNLYTGKGGPTRVALVVAVTPRGTRTEVHPQPVAALLPRFPDSWCRPLPDLELLRHGLLTPPELHPLVRAAMFPDDPDAGRVDAYRPIAAPDPAAPTRVRCGSGWHRIAWRDGRLSALDHGDITASDADPGSGCAGLHRAWRAGRRLPRAVRQLHRHLVLATLHGDHREVRRLLNMGLDPVGVHDRRHRSLLHLAGRIGLPELVERLLDAGVGLEDRDIDGRTPLLATLADDAPAAVVRALLDAGADPHARDHHGYAALDLLRCRDAASIVPWLLDAGLSTAAARRKHHRPLIVELVARGAPAEAVRALLDAGAPPVTGAAARGIEQHIARHGRTDLGFLRSAPTYGG